MSDFAARLQRRAQGGEGTMLPYLPDRPVDPRLGPASSLVDLGPPEDPFANAIQLPPSTQQRRDDEVRRAISASPPPPAIVIERHSERLIERVPRLGPESSHPPVPAAAADRQQHDLKGSVSPPASKVAAPARVPMALDPPAASQRYTATPPSPRTQKLSTPPSTSTPLAEPSPHVARRRDVTVPMLERPVSHAAEPVTTPPAPPSQTSPPVTRLEPLAREAPPNDIRPEPPSPHVVIGNLSIEVVQAPQVEAPRAPRPQPREAPRPAVAASNSSTPRTRRRSVFGLGQL